MIKPKRPMSSDDFNQDFVDKRREARMQKIDDLPKGVRRLVHEYSFHVVDAFLMIGVTNPKHIRHLVETVLNEFSPTRGSFSAQGARSTISDKEEPS